MKYLGTTLCQRTPAILDLGRSDNIIYTWCIQVLAWFFWHCVEMSALSASSIVSIIVFRETLWTNSCRWISPSYTNKTQSLSLTLSMSGNPQSYDSWGNFYPAVLLCGTIAGWGLSEQISLKDLQKKKPSILEKKKSCWYVNHLYYSCAECRFNRIQMFGWIFQNVAHRIFGRIIGFGSQYEYNTVNRFEGTCCRFLRATWRLPPFPLCPARKPSY